jgi:DNA-binding NarL/FixJ family response regulator
MTNKKIKIFLVDDHPLFREGLKFILSQVSNFEIIGEASDGSEFLAKIENQLPDIALMDISMIGMDGIEATEKTTKKYPGLKIIAITSFGDEVYYLKMIKAGASGFIQKKTSIEELQKAIDTVTAGDNYFPQNILQRLLLKISNNNDTDSKIHSNPLSQREKEILVLICQGFSNNEIGEKLFISPKTVDNHRTSLLSKTSTRNSAHLVMYAIKNNLVEL